MVKISVIIPVYNVEEYLEECLSSVVNQTFDDIEIICINDGSTDNSLDILEKFAKSDERIRIISQENKGLGATKNVGLRHVNGEYVFFVDSDDYIALDALEKLYENSQSNDSDLVIYKVARFVEGKPIDYSAPGFNFDDIFHDVDFNHFAFNYSDIKKYVMNASYSTCLKLYKKEFLFSDERFTFPEGIAFEDVPFHVKVLLKASKISFVPEFLYFYRNNPYSIVNTSSNGFDIFQICDMVEDFLIDENYYDEFKREFDLAKISNIIAYMLSTNSEEYFKLAKSEYEKMDLGKNHLVYLEKLNKYKLVLSSDSLEDYKINLKKLEEGESNKNKIKDSQKNNQKNKNNDFKKDNKNNNHKKNKNKNSSMTSKLKKSLKPIIKLIK